MYQFQEFYIPERMMGGIRRYIEHGIKPGDFLCAVIDNDLALACGRADNENQKNIPAYPAYFYNEAPRACYGDSIKRIEWQLSGGLKGREKKFKKTLDKTSEESPANFDPTVEGRELIVEQIIRPTGLLDPVITIKPLKGQIDETIELCRQRIEKGERVLVTTLTKRTAEDLTDYLRNVDLKVRYIHSEVDAIERGVNALRDPAAWNGEANPSIRDICDIAEALAAFLEWDHDLPGATGTRSASTRTTPIQSLSLHT